MDYWEIEMVFPYINIDLTTHVWSLQVAILQVVFQTVLSERPPLYAIAGLPGNGQLLVRYPTPRSLKPPLPTGVLQSVIAVASRFSYYILLKNLDPKYNSEHCTMRINDVA